MLMLRYVAVDAPLRVFYSGGREKNASVYYILYIMKLYECVERGWQENTNCLDNKTKWIRVVAIR